MEYNYLYNKELDNLENGNSILDENYCTLKEIKFMINENNNKEIKNEDGEFEFTVHGENSILEGHFSHSKVILKSKKDDLMICLKNQNLNDIIKKEICITEKNNKLVSEIVSTGFGAYKVNFFNLKKSKSEYFEMLSDINLQICDIFQGKKDKGAPMICKIIRNNNNNNCEVVIASGVDYIPVLSLATFFFCKNFYSTNKDFEKNYDTIARLDMPTIPALSTSSSISNIPNATSPLITNKKIENNIFDEDKYSTIIEIEDTKSNEKKKKSFLYSTFTVLCCCWYCFLKDDANTDQSKPFKTLKEECKMICFESFFELIDLLIDCIDCSGCDCSGCDCSGCDCSGCDCSGLAC